MKFVLTLLFAGLLLQGVDAQEYQNSWESLDKRPIPTWFEDAKFGIFIHWGVYSVPAWRKLEPGLYASYAEWYYARVMYNEKNGGKAFHVRNYGEDFEYRDFAPLFKAELFDPAEWATLFAASGAKYVVLTSKHHDGYCLWSTKSPYKKDWNVMDVGPERDLVGDLTTAVKASGLKMGLYYSIIEWETSKTQRTASGYFLPDTIISKYSIPESDYVVNHVIPQLTELVEWYEPSLIFSDGGEWNGSDDYWKTKEFLAWLYNESPVKNSVVVNDRFAKGMPGNHGDYYSSEYKDADENVLSYHPWEESRGVGGSYGFNRAEGIEDYSSSEELVHELIDIVSRGGNLLLNVGPTADGRIPVIMQERLKDIGRWLAVNGEAIYGTRKVSFAMKNSNPTLFYTQKEPALFCIFTQWSDTIEVEIEKGKEVENIAMLGIDEVLKWEKIDDTTLSVVIPQLTINKIPCYYAWALKVTYN